MQRRQLFPLGLIVAASAYTAVACPLCDSERGVEVREILAEEDPATTSLAMLAPFGALGIVLVFTHFALGPATPRPTPWRHSDPTLQDVPEGAPPPAPHGSR